MKSLLFIIVVLCSAVSFAQDKDAYPLESVTETVNAKSIAVTTKAVVHTAAVVKSTTLQPHSETLAVTRSEIAQTAKTEVSEVTNNKSSEGNIPEMNEVSITLLPLIKPASTNPVRTSKVQKD